MAINYGDLGPADDQVRCRAQVDDVTLGAGSRADLNLRLERVAGDDTTVDVAVLLWNTAGGDPATIDPPGTVLLGVISVGFKGDIPLPSNVETDVHFLIDNPAGGAAIAEYIIIVVLSWDGTLVIAGPTPQTSLTPAW
jgi:hypothetical protein